MVFLPNHLKKPASMNRPLYCFLILSLLFCFNSYGQIQFEPGYFVDNSGTKTDCLIKNVEWQYSPNKFNYKFTEDGTVETGSLETVKEFGIANRFKYVRATVDIDKSSNNVNHLKNTKNPEFQEQTLFLQVLVEGQASLYSYQGTYFKRFFYKTDGVALEQLVYKKYRTSTRVENENVWTQKKLANKRGMAENNWFRQQLWNNLKCESFSRKRLENLKYAKSPLIKLFSDYNACANGDFVSYENKAKRDYFNLTIRPGIKSSSMSIMNDIIPALDDIDFGNQIGLRLGLEAEVILPFNRNKWGIILEPTYQYFSGEQTIESNNVSGGIINTTLDYKSIEVPVGVRHYFFLNDRAKIFINVSYLADITTESLVDFKRLDGSEFNGPLEAERETHLVYGIGYKALDKLSLELRYQGTVNTLDQYSFWASDYTGLSFIFGYTLF